MFSHFREVADLSCSIYKWQGGEFYDTTQALTTKRIRAEKKKKRIRAEKSERDNFIWGKNVLGFQGILPFHHERRESVK